MRAGTAGGILLGGFIAFSILFTAVLSQDNRSAGKSPAPASVPEGSTDTESTGSFPPIDNVIGRFDDFLNERLDSLETVGAAATVYHEDKVVYTLTYGVRRAGTTDSVDRNTVFRLASVSKGFAGVLACQLHEQGKILLDDKVISYLPDFRLKDTLSTRELAIRHLLSHTSGLVPHAFDNLAEAGQKIDEILPRLPEVNISGPPGKLYGYQNVLFSLVDTIACLATGKTYADLMAENIFIPLGMKNACTGYRSLVWNPNVAFPHAKRRGEFYPLPLHTGYYNLLPAAGVNASINDMGKWLEALLGNRPEAISPAVISLISTPQIRTPLKRAYTRHWDPIDERYYSFGWRIFDYKGHRILYHGGYVKGYRAEIAVCPELKTGLAFLQNSPNGIASRCVPTFFNLFFEELGTD